MEVLVSNMGKEEFKKYNFKDDVERALITRADSNYCEKCGHRQLLHGKNKEICGYCGTLVFRNDKVKFEYRLKEARAREKRKNDGKHTN